jgi:hypothetical protein
MAMEVARKPLMQSQASFKLPVMSGFKSEWCPNLGCLCDDLATCLKLFFWQPNAENPRQWEKLPQTSHDLKIATNFYFAGTTATFASATLVNVASPL